MSQLKLYVSGMSCNGCVNSVRTIISKGLELDKETIEVDLDNGTAVIRPEGDFDLDDERLAKTLYELKKQGFPAQNAR